MKKRNIIIAVVTATVTGSGIAIAGSKSCEYGGGSHGFGGHHGGPKLERMIGKMSHHLDLSDEQQSSLEQIVAANKQTMKGNRAASRSLRQETMKLDPGAENYATKTAEMADQFAALARDKALLRADIFKQVSDILTEQQRTEVREMMARRMEKMQRHASKHQDT